MDRSPIVVILGHVDHGKTTLLDTLRLSQIAAGEAGGITQSIGAYQVSTNNKTITFIDTPGHAAFTAMRARGAQVADIAIIVISAVDGVQPQTIESLETVKTAAIPYIIAINKIDSPEADPTKIKTQLLDTGIAVEGFGGNIPTVEISAKTGKNIPDLLDLVTLVFQLEEIKSQPNAPLQAPVIESGKDHRVGPTVSVVVRNGTIHTGDTIYAGDISGKIRAILNDKRQPVKSLLPAQPGLLLGFTKVIPVGTLITDRPQAIGKPSAQTPATTMADISPGAPRYIIKADTTGSLAALRASVPADARIISQSVGNINESDVLLAESTRAAIIGFRSQVPSQVAALAQAHHVGLTTNPIIYRLLEDMVNMTDKPKPAEVELGRAKILKVFTIDDQQIAGCKIISGRLAVGDRVRLSGNNFTIEAIIQHLKQGKSDVKTANSQQECGVLLNPVNGQKLNLSVGDVIISYRQE